MNPSNIQLIRVALLEALKEQETALEEEIKAKTYTLARIRHRMRNLRVEHSIEQVFVNQQAQEK